MSAEVQCSPADPGLTAGSPGGAQGEKHSKPGETRQEDRERGGSEAQPADRNHESEECKENDKENEQREGGSNADSAVQVVKKKVVEAPPPKVNPWTKRTTGKVPANKITPSSQETGKTFKSVTFRQVNLNNMAETPAAAAGLCQG